MTTLVNLGLGYFPRDWQRQVHLGMKRFNVVAVHRRGGKSEVGIMELIHRALTTKLDQWLGYYVSPYLKQTRAIAWARLKSKIKPLLEYDLVTVNESEMSVTFKQNGAVIKLFGADNEHAMRGVRLDFCVLDEMAQIKPSVWIDIVQPALADRMGSMIAIGTPFGINAFSELYFKAADLPDWFAARFTCYDTNALDPGEVERLKRDMSETSFAREMLCDFSAAGDDQLISLSDVEAAAKRIVMPGDIRNMPKIMGVDPARFGDDRSVIIRRQGLQVYEPLVYRGIDNMDLAARVAAQIDAWQPDACFVDAGQGSGVIDRLRQLSYNPIEVHFGGKSPDANYINQRGYMWFMMRDWIRGGGAIPDLVDFKQDLATPIYWYDAQGRLVLEPKDDIKKRGLPSPDLGDALALTFAQPVARAEDSFFANMLKANRQKEYDPYKAMA
jgi:hypothetical protein